MQEAGVAVDTALADTVAAAPVRAPPRAHLSAIPSAAAQQKTVQLGTLEPPTLALLRHWLKPAVVAATFLFLQAQGEISSS